MGKAHPFFGKSIEVGGDDLVISIAAQHIESLLVGEDKYQVRGFGFSCKTG
jgi:hypothetical protein